MTFTLPPYPYDRLDDLKGVAAACPGGLVDLSVGAPCDPPPAEVVEALATSGAERGYPASVGTLRFREAAVGWMARRLGVRVPVDAVAACVGTKEFVATVPRWLRLRRPERDTVLFPAVAYPTYEMGATLAGCRAVAVPVGADWRLDLGAVAPADVDRALCLWVNSPANPTGAVDDLAAVAAWGRGVGVPVFSDECYVEFTWEGSRTTVLGDGLDGVMAVHSLSKRSNLAGVRAGFYAGDPELVRFISEIRKHAGLMVPGPVQAAASVAFDDDEHVERQRTVYRERLGFLEKVLVEAGAEVASPAGGFYLWARSPGGDAWAFAAALARRGGVLVAPGDLYGEQPASHVRVAAVQPMDRLRVAADRLSSAP